jgi:quercetin dioxygenase-like cupin family protein
MTELISESELHRPNRGNCKTIQFSDPVDILSLVNYQEGAVISRILSSAQCGSVTLFAFDQGQGLSEHTSPFNALVQILEGNAEIFVSGRRTEVTRGRILTLPANQPHSLNAVSKFKMLLTMIR